MCDLYLSLFSSSINKCTIIIYYVHGSHEKACDLRLNIPLLWSYIWFIFLFFQEFRKTISISFRILTTYLLCLYTSPGSEETGLGGKGILYCLYIITPAPTTTITSFSTNIIINCWRRFQWKTLSYWECATYPSLPHAALDSLLFRHLSFHAFI